MTEPDPLRDFLETLVRRSIELGWDLRDTAPHMAMSREQCVEDAARRSAPILDRATTTIRRLK